MPQDVLGIASHLFYRGRMHEEDLEPFSHLGLDWPRSPDQFGTLDLAPIPLTPDVKGPIAGSFQHVALGPPRVRGTDGLATPNTCPRRIIPACAGNGRTVRAS